MAARLTQEETAERMGSNYKYVQEIERGIANLRVSTLERLAKALRLSFWELMTPPTPRKRRSPRP